MRIKVLRPPIFVSCQWRPEALHGPDHNEGPLRHSVLDAGGYVASRQDILLELEASKEDYGGAKGLVNAVLGFSSDNKSVIAISVWESQAAAEVFLTSSWETQLSRRWQAAPMIRQEWETPCVVSKNTETLSV